MWRIIFLGIIIFCLNSCHNISKNNIDNLVSLDASEIDTNLNLVPLKSFIESPRRAFSLTHPAIDDVEVLFVWIMNQETKKKQLHFKSQKKEFVLNEIFNKVVNTDINGIGVQAYEEISVYSNNQYNIIISSSPESASLVYWIASVKIFKVGSKQPIFDKVLIAEDIQ